jgi:hypothetical protein
MGLQIACPAENLFFGVIYGSDTYTGVFICIGSNA